MGPTCHIVRCFNGLGPAGVILLCRFAWLLVAGGQGMQKFFETELEILEDAVLSRRLGPPD